MKASEPAKELIAYYVQLCGVEPNDPLVAEELVWYYPLTLLRQELDRIAIYLPKSLSYLRKVIMARISPTMHRGIPLYFLTKPAVYQAILAYAPLTLSDMESANIICRDFSLIDVQQSIRECRRYGVYNVQYLLRVLEGKQRAQAAARALIQRMRQQASIVVARFGAQQEDHLASLLIAREAQRHEN